MKKFYLVQAVLRSKYGVSTSKHRIVVADDPIGAARACFEDLPSMSKDVGGKFPEMFKVYPERDRETFMEEVGPITLVDSYDEGVTLDYIVDMFEAKAIEVRL
jgi:hypothetical protein